MLVRTVVACSSRRLRVLASLYIYVYVTSVLFLSSNCGVDRYVRCVVFLALLRIRRDVIIVCYVGRVHLDRAWHIVENLLKRPSVVPATFRRSDRVCVTRFTMTSVLAARLLNNLSVLCVLVWSRVTEFLVPLSVAGRLGTLRRVSRLLLEPLARAIMLALRSRLISSV